MALFDKRDKRTTRHEYVLPNPVNWAEVGKALTAAARDYETVRGRPADDSIWITHADEEIIIYWEEQN